MKTTTEQVDALYQRGMRASQIAKELGVTKSTVSFHLKKLGKQKNKSLPPPDWNAVKQFYAEGHSMNECSEKFRFTYLSWTKAVKRGLIQPRGLLPLEQHKRRGSVRQRLVKDGTIPYCCQQCGIDPEWRGAPLSLVLDHINGKRDDHRIENLRFLCPNCNSQTSTFSGRNVKRNTVK